MVFLSLPLSLGEMFEGDFEDTFANKIISDGGQSNRVMCEQIQGARTPIGILYNTLQKYGFGGRSNVL